MSIEAQLYQEFLKVWGKPVKTVDFARAKAWDKYKRNKLYNSKDV